MTISLFEISKILYINQSLKQIKIYIERIYMTKMTTEEAFIKVLQKHGIEHAFGIIGSAFMPISDLFP